MMTSSRILFRHPSWVRREWVWTSRTHTVTRVQTRLGQAGALMMGQRGRRAPLPAGTGARGGWRTGKDDVRHRPHVSGVPRRRLSGSLFGDGASPTPTPWIPSAGVLEEIEWSDWRFGFPILGFGFDPRSSRGVNGDNVSCHAVIRMAAVLIIDNWPMVDLVLLRLQTISSLAGAISRVSRWGEHVSSRHRLSGDTAQIQALGTNHDAVIDPGRRFPCHL